MESKQILITHVAKTTAARKFCAFMKGNTSPYPKLGIVCICHLNWYDTRSRLRGLLIWKKKKKRITLVESWSWFWSSPWFSYRLSDGKEQQRETQLATENNGDLLVTLDARGYTPNDISVKLEGRILAVVAMKQAGLEESQSCSSYSSCASVCSSTSSQIGFAQKIDLPAHLDLCGLSCSLMDDGQLCIHAPRARQPVTLECPVPIRFRSSLEFPITKDKAEKNRTD